MFLVEARRPSVAGLQFRETSEARAKGARIRQGFPVESCLRIFRRNRCRKPTPQRLGGEIKNRPLSSDVRMERYREAKKLESSLLGNSPSLPPSILN
jgi:hypothetical protein